MHNVFYAEWLKQVKNFRLTSFLVWIYPVGVAALLGLLLIVSALTGNLSDGLPFGPGVWTRDLLGPWGIVTAFPQNVFGRMLPLAFLAVVFASEYQMATWKNLVPRTGRVQLLLAKLLVPTVLIMLSLALTAVILAAGNAIGSQLVGETPGPALNAQTLREFGPELLREAGLALIALLLLGASAACAAVLTRSVLGALLLSFGFSLLDLISSGILLAAGFFLDRPDLINLLQYTPNYSLENIRSWLVRGTPAPSFWPTPAFTVEPTLAFSWVVLAIWVAGLAMLAVLLFQRQDITE